MTTRRKAAAVKFGVPILILTSAATLALRCSGRHDGGSLEVRRSALSITEISASWWKLPCPTCGTATNVALAAFTTASRGTEIFNAFPGSLSGIEANRTVSNIERSFVSSALDATSKDVTTVATASRDGGSTVDVFYRLSDQTMTSRSWNGGILSSPSPLPSGLVLAGVGAASMTNREDVFAVGTDHNLYQALRTTGGWTGWYGIGAPSGAGLASLQPGVVWVPGNPNTIHVFAVAPDGTVWTRQNPDSPTWSPWTSLSGNVSSGIAVTFAAPSRIDLFAVHSGTGDIDWAASDDGGASFAWQTPIRGPSAGVMTANIAGFLRYVAPTAIARAEGVIDLFVRDANGDTQLMTIRPPNSLSGSSERAIGEVVGGNCAGDLTVFHGENTAMSSPACGGVEYLAYGNFGTYLMSDAAFFFTGLPAPNQTTSCTVPSMAGTTATLPMITPLYEFRFAANPHDTPPPVTNIPFTGVPFCGTPPCSDTYRYFSQDHQSVRLSDGSLVELRHYSICSDHACSLPATICGNHAPATSADLIYRMIPGGDCTTAGGGQNAWTYQGIIDPCHQIDPYGSNSCYSKDNCDGGSTGTDRPEMIARGTDLFVAEKIVVGNLPPGWSPLSQIIWKSSTMGQTWSQWGTLLAESPIEITTVGKHVITYGRDAGVYHKPALWSQSTDDNSRSPTLTSLDFTDLDDLNYGGGLFNGSALSVALASHSDDGDYIRIVYTTLATDPATGYVTQAARTGLVRVNGDESMTALTETFSTGPQIVAPGQGSILWPTLIEAERVSGPNGDERPSVVLYWVETTKTPPASDGQCDLVGGAIVSGGGCDWGSVSIRAMVFRGASQFGQPSRAPNGTPQSAGFSVTTAASKGWRRNGDYIHGASRYTTAPADRFFLHWYNEKYNPDGSGSRMLAGRLLDVPRW